MHHRVVQVLKVAQIITTKQPDVFITPEKVKELTNECYTCKYRRNVPGSCHSECVKPDLDMTGNQHGIQKGWFMYPINFDPVWKTKNCDNFEAVSAVSHPVSGVV